MINLLNTHTLCIAHRGASSLAPENTLAAAQKALQLGADMWELDVSVTADGELVVLHDDSLVRTTDVQAVFPRRAPWLISDFTLAEIKTLDAGSWFVETDPFGTIAAGVVTPAEQDAWRGEPIPTLAEALMFTWERDWRVNVEIKELVSPLEAFPVVEAVIELIETLDMVDQVLLSSFVHTTMRRAKSLQPAIAVAALLDVGEPLILPEIQKLGEDRAIPFDAIHPHYTSVDPETTRTLRQVGVAVNPWTVNDPLKMECLIEAGVTGIFTDFPQILKQVESQQF
ncbi:MAG TPA: glycerophosphodiester phosphodiesterase family protein [Anaerolineae bacterium]|nr:glycerophosphodiester phosphodiesterase family protein [Anaerolineae bacterium]